MKNREQFNQFIQEKPLMHYKLLLALPLSALLAGLLVLAFVPSMSELGKLVIVFAAITLPIFLYHYRTRAKLGDTEKTQTISEYSKGFAKHALIFLFIGVPCVTLAMGVSALGYKLSAYILGMAATAAVIPTLSVKYKLILSILFLLVGVILGVNQHA